MPAPRLAWPERVMARGSLARHLLARVLSVLVCVCALHLIVLWAIIRTADTDTGSMGPVILAVVLVGYVLIIGACVWTLLAGVRSGLSAVYRVSAELDQRSIEDLQPLPVQGLSTEIRPLVSHLNNLLLRLDDSVQAQKRFIGHAAHQLRTPLAGLKLESELMLTGELPADLRQRAERIKHVTDNMIRLGQQLLVLARVDESGRPQDSFVRLDLCEWVRSSGAEWIPQARAQRVEMQLVAPARPVWIDADPILLEELLGNLIDNALRYGCQGGRLELQVTANPPSLVVEDLGAGIAAADVGRVFEPFFRSDSAAGSGSGLGLAIVREIARAHGGWWSVVSRPRVPGTRIAVVFPGPRIGARLSRY